MKTYKEVKNLLTIGDAKTSKGEKLGYKTAILYMSPHKQNSKGKNLCAFASKGCAAACLFTAGRGKFSNVQKARINKTEYFLNDRDLFMNQLFNEISKLYKKYGDTLVIRLNGTTDIPFERIKINRGENNFYTNIFQAFPSIMFYDYTKNPARLYQNKEPNYQLTFSRSEDEQNRKWVKVLLRDGFNVAVVFESDLYNMAVAHSYLTGSNGIKISIVDGDKHDLRFLDGSFSIVALKAKGDAKKDTTGFILNTQNLQELWH